jgi:hypothetical protein
MQGKDVAKHPDGIDLELRAMDDANQFLCGGGSSEDLDVQDGDLDPPDGEEIDDDEEVQRHVRSRSFAFELCPFLTYVVMQWLPCSSRFWGTVFLARTKSTRSKQKPALVEGACDLI